MANRNADQARTKGESMDQKTENRTQGRSATAKTPAAVTEKPLLELWDAEPGGPYELLPHPGASHAGGLPLPPDFDYVIGFHAGECLRFHEEMMEMEPWFYWWLAVSYEGDHFSDRKRVDNDFPRYYFEGHGHRPPPLIDENGNDLSDSETWGETNLGLSERQLFAIGVAMRDAMTHGFQLALLRYQDELKGVPEAAALMESFRNRAVKMNDAKRQKPRLCGEQMMTLDERDAAIVAEFPELKKRLGSTGAQERLAMKYGLESDKQVRNIIKKAKRKTPSESLETP